MLKLLKIITLGAAAASLLGGAVSAAADGLYRWVDEKGVVHYGDSVPAEFSTIERQVLNEQAVPIKTLARQKTQDELVAEAARAAEQEQQRLAMVRQQERDQMLLETYLSVEEIANLRDRRVTAIDAQVGVTRHYLRGLQEQWEYYEDEANKYNFPYVADSELPPLPEDLAQHIIHTEKAMAEHMQTIQALRREQAQIRASFAADMERFQELKADLTQ